MKKLTTIAAGFFLLFALSAFTPVGVNVSSKIKANFEQTFSAVSEVKWTAYQDIYVASFNEKGRDISAAYTAEGELICIGKSMTVDQLPINVTRALESKYAGYNINPEVVEISTETTSYVITAENEKFILKISADGSGNLYIQDKTKKKSSNTGNRKTGNGNSKTIST